MIIVTGGAGFIGSNLVKALNDSGEDDILIVDHLGHTEKWKNLVDLKFRDFEGKDDFLVKLAKGYFDFGVWAIFHLGACSSTTEKDADYLMSNNYQYSKTLASRFAAKKGVRFVYASSAATYGDGELGYSDEHDVTPRYRPLNMYGYSKQMFDMWALNTGFLKNAVGLKYFNVFGPNEYHKEDMRSVAIRAYYQAKQGGVVKLFKSYKPKYADGEQRRDFIYVKDAVNITLHFLERPEMNGLYNAGTGAAQTFKALAAAVFKALDMEPKIQYIPMPEGLQPKYQYFTEADTKKLETAGFTRQFTSLDDAVRDYVVNYLAKHTD